MRLSWVSLSLAGGTQIAGSMPLASPTTSRSVSTRSVLRPAPRSWAAEALHTPDAVDSYALVQEHLRLADEHFIVLGA